MKRRYRIGLFGRGRRILWILLGIVAAGLGVYALLPREPMYQGKPVSYWLDLALRQNSFPPVAIPGQASRSPNRIFQAREAVAAIGPRALPYIADRAGGNFSPMARAYLHLHDKLPSAVSKHLPRPKPTGRAFGLVLTGGYFVAATERAGTNAIPMLVKLSTAKNPEVRRAVILSLSGLAAKDHKRTLPVFARALRDLDLAVRHNALRQLCQMAGTEPQVALILATYVREAGTNIPAEMRLNALAGARAAGSLTNLRTNSTALSLPGSNLWERAFATLADWQHSSTSERKREVFTAFEAAFASKEESPSLDRTLVCFHFTAEQEVIMLVPLLGKALRSSNSTVRNSAASLLQDLGHAAQPAVLAMVEALNDPTQSAPSYLVNAFANLGSKAAPAVPTLTRLLDQEGISLNAIFALGQIGPDARAAVPALMRKAKNMKEEQRFGCLSAVAQIAPQTTELIPTLVGILKEGGEDERSWAARVLGQTGLQATNALPALKKVMLEDEWLDSRLDAAEAILRIDPKHRSDLVPVLVESLSWMDSDDHVNPATVARLLGQIGQPALPALPELVKLLRHKEEPVRIAAAESLAILEPVRKPESVATLRGVIAQSDNASMRFRAARALWRVVPDNRAEAVAELTRLLAPRNGYNQVDVTQLLGEIGPAARTAIPQLREALESQDWRIRRAARDALAKIQGGTSTHASSGARH